MIRFRLAALSAAAAAGAALGQPAVPPAGGAPAPKVEPTPGATATPPGTADKDKDKEKAEPAAKLATDDPLVKEAFAHFGKNEMDKCLEKLQEAFDKNKDMQPPQVMYAIMLFNAKQGSAARQVLEQFIARNLDHPDGYLLNASFAFGEGRVTDAIHNCLQGLQLARSGTRWNTAQVRRFERESRLGIVACLEQRGDYGNMHDHLDALVRADEKNAALHQRLAAVKFNIGRVESALAELVEAYKLDPAVDPPELRMGAFWAAKPPTSGRDLGPKPTPEQIERAVAEQKREIAENRGRAEEQLKIAVSKYPDDPKPSRGYASFLLEERRLADALAQITEAENKDKKKPQNMGKEARETTALRALQLRYDGKYAEAIPLFKQLFDVNPADPFATGNLAICMAERATGDDLEKARNSAASLVKSNEKSPEAYAVLGWVMFKSAQKETNDDKKKEYYEAADKALGAAASGGQAMLDTAYYLAEFFNYKQMYKKSYDLLKEATGKKGAFVYFPKAEKLRDEVKPKAEKEEADAKKKAEDEKNKPKP